MRYRIVHLANDDGSNPVLSASKVAAMHSVMQAAFAGSKLNWEMIEVCYVHAHVLENYNL